MITVQHNLDSLNQILPEYQRVAKLTTEQVLAKKGYDLVRGIPGVFMGLADRLRMLAPGRGSITQDRLADLKAGKGIKVRESVLQKVMYQKGVFLRIADRKKNKSGAGRGIKGLRFGATKGNPDGRASDKKGLNLWQLAVKRELSTRESARGYTGFGTSINVRGINVRKLQKHIGRVKQQLAEAGLGTVGTASSLKFTFGGFRDGRGDVVGLGDSLKRPRAQAVIASTLNDLRADMQTYLRRKHTEALQGAADKAAKVGRRVAS